MAEMATLKQRNAAPQAKLTPKNIKVFCSALHDKLLDGNSKFGKEYLKLLISEIRLNGKEVYVKGYNSGVLKVLQQKKLGTRTKVPSSVINWLPSHASGVISAMSQRKWTRTTDLACCGILLTGYHVNIG